MFVTVVQRTVGIAGADRQTAAVLTDAIMPLRRTPLAAADAQLDAHLVLLPSSSLRSFQARCPRFDISPRMREWY